VQSTKEVEIIRLTRNEGVFSAHRLSSDELVAALHKPTLRAESVLDGIFSESVVVLEADSDRLVYHTAWETMSSELRLDVHFAAVGGTGGIADICGLYRRLKIPVAVIADLDLVADDSKLSRILWSLTSEVNAAALLLEAGVVRDKIRKLPPTMTPHEFGNELKGIGTLPTSWENNDDAVISAKMRRLANDLDRMRRIKKGGLRELPAEIAEPLGELLVSLAQSGLFLVPVGELEEWLASEKITESKSDKPAWANAAAIKIQSIGSAKGDIWDFLRGVGGFLRSETIREAN
jgi:hypothetical protein